MLKTRVIAKLEIKGPNVIKGVQMEGLRVVGNPNDLARKYQDQGADELVLIDVVASLYGRNNLFNIVQDASKDVFIPITVGGGIRSLADVKRLMESGADKIAVNTAAVKRPELIKEIAEKYGSQCICLSVHAKRIQDAPPRWEVMTEAGREPAGIDVLDWVKQAQSLGAGEILLTSIDRDGTFSGLDVHLVQRVSEAAYVPVVVCGGLGGPQDAILGMGMGADAICCASVLHYDKTTIRQIKDGLKGSGYPVREA